MRPGAPEKREIPASRHHSGPAPGCCRLEGDQKEKKKKKNQAGHPSNGVDAVLQKRPHGQHPRPSVAQDKGTEQNRRCCSRCLRRCRRRRRASGARGSRRAEAELRARVAAAAVAAAEVE